MWTYTLFQIGSILILLLLSIKFVLYTINFFFKEKPFLTKVLKWISNKFLWIVGLTALSVFVLCSIAPLLASQRDLAMIEYHTKNIELYNNYIDEYSDAARQQIEQYQQFQSEMARTATALQLQFWADQQDSVGDQLTNTIRDFNNKIMQDEIDINRRTALISARNRNKLFFWHQVEL